jgi:AcrR family transcriptional regulator
MEELIGKISELFLKYGVKSVTMDDIARELGISKKTLYLYFTDKKDVVMKFIEYSISNQACNIKEKSEVTGENAIDTLLNVSQILISAQNKVNPNVNYDLQKYYPEAWEKIKGFRQERLFNRIRMNIVQGISEGIYRDDFNIEVICHLYVLHIEKSYTELLNNTDIKFDELLRTLFMYHIRGISSKAGIEYIEQKLGKQKS